MLMVIDDERAVRRVLATSLEIAGHTVLTAATGREGVQLFRDHHSEIELVLLDVTMPEMSGEQTLRALQAIAPRVRVVLMSGHSEGEVHFARGELVGFLGKPFARDELLAVIDNALGGVSRKAQADREIPGASPAERDVASVS